MKADAEAEQKAQEAAVQTFLHPWAKDSKDKKEAKSATPKVEKVMRAVKSVDDTKVETTEKKEDKTEVKEADTKDAKTEAEKSEAKNVAEPAAEQGGELSLDTEKDNYEEKAVLQGLWRRSTQKLLAEETLDSQGDNSQDK